MLRPALTVRNTGDQVSRIRGKIPYTLPNGEMASVNIPSSVVAPNSTRIINLHNLIQNVPTSVTYAGIELEYNTPKGSVITAVQSVSQNGDHVFQVPMFDPQKIPSSAAGFPWKAEGDYHTIIYAKNESDAPQKFVTHLVYEDGQYSAGEREIKPGQTLAVDFRELRDAQTPDGLRRLIPLEVNKGQIAFSIRGGQNKTLSVRSEQISLSEGVSSTYSCLNCPCPNRVIDGSIDPVSIEDVVGGTMFLLGVQVEENCYSTQFNSAIPYINWSSLDTNVETVDSSGYAQAVGVGTTSITASWDRVWYLYGEFSTCEPITYPENDDAPVKVRPRVTITPFEAVGKDGTFSVSVQVLGNTNGAQITLELRKLSGTGESLFTNGNAPTIAITQTGNYEIKGVTESSVKDNYVIEAKLDGSVLGSEAFSIAKIKISRTIGAGQPSEITSTTINTIVGERIKLAAEVLPTGVTVSSQQWTIPQKIMKDFVVTGNAALVVSVTGLNTANADFVWYDGADGREVTYTAVSGGNLVGKATFNVKRPEASVVTIATSGSSTTIDTATGDLEMHYGGTTAQTAGIRFSRSSLSIPSPFSGTTQWVQTTSASLTVTTTGNVTSTSSASGLDGCYPFTTSVTSAWDSPGVRLTGFVYADLDAQWSMWLMFKPSGGDSSWVPLRKVDWRWLAEAQQVNNVWALVGNTDPHVPNQPTDADSTVFPVWASVVGTCVP